MHLNIVTLFALLSAALWAADLRNPVTLSGELVMAEQGGGSAFLVELRSLDARPSPGLRTQVNNDGSFEFRHMQPGTYELQVTTQHGNPIRTDIVHVNAQNSRITVRMDGPGTPSKQKGVVSFRRLVYKPPKAAYKEFKRAESAVRRGEDRQAIDHLRKAVELSPEYAEAHNNLGVRYLIAGDFARSRTHLERSLELDEGSAYAHLNLSAVALSVDDAPRAEFHARRSLALGGDQPKSEYLLGLALAKQGDHAAAIPRLKEAVQRFPRARLALADLLSRQGDLAGAERHLREYLDSDNPERRPEIEQWMKSLRSPR